MPYVDDLKPGQTYQLGEYTVTRDEIIRFAEVWDPQRFHLDDEDDGATPFHGLAASGWHTTAIYMKLFVSAFIDDGTGMGSPGVDELRWPEPVRPGDTLTATLTVERIMPSIGSRDRALLIPKCELVNQDGTTVMSMRMHNLLPRRPVETAGPIRGKQM